VSTATKERVTLPGGSKPSKSQPTRRRTKRMGRPRGSRNKFFGLPIVDAKESLTIPLLQMDVEKASAVKADDVNAQENFLACVIAQGATRVCGAERVAIMREHAYVAYPGDERALRYVIDGRSRAVLEAWDRGEPVVEGVELRLRAPSKGKALAYSRKRAREWRKKNPGRARKTARKQRPSDPLHNVVRNGNLVRWS
jgi:hypothetical protein